MDLRNASWNFSIFFPDPKWATITQNSISRRSQIQTSKNRPKTTKTPPGFGLGAKIRSRCEIVFEPRSAKADIATAILINIIEHLVLLIAPQ